MVNLQKIARKEDYVLNVVASSGCRRWSDGTPDNTAPTAEHVWTEVTAMRLIDGDTLWEKLDDEPWYDNADRDEIALPIVAAAPTVDAVVVTRCKNCAHKERATVNEKGFLICPASGMEITPDDFCSYGEPKET